MKTPLLFFVFLCTFVLQAQTIDLEEFATGFDNPVEIVHAGDSRLFVAEQTGQIKILNADGTTNETPFLDVTSLISQGVERGLLGLAFPVDYAENGAFYINYTNSAGDTVIARYFVSASDSNVADSSTATILLTIDQPQANHNGGCLRFGPDGFLYISMGDGGGAGDEDNNAQNKNVLLGKMLRIDVNGDLPYAIPATNPFVGIDGADEIWAYGLRNAWKFSFDRLTGDMWIADVGQGLREEINKIVTPVPAGLNFGWRCYEGSAVYDDSECSDTGTFTFPITEYTHASIGGCSITGGYVYRGATYPALQGKYIFADYCADKLGMVGIENEIEFTEAFSGNNFTVFGEDNNGELYIGGGTSGTIYRVIDADLGTGEYTRTPFTVYPNPLSDVIYIKSSADAFAAHVQVFDMSGKTLLDERPQHEAVNTIDATSLPSGFYVMTITDDNGAKYNRKLSVQ